MSGRKPPFSTPTRLAAGTRTPSKCSVAVSEHHQPVFGSSWRTSPSAGTSTTMSEIPCGPGPPVRTATVHRSARMPEVIVVLVPVIT